MFSSAPPVSESLSDLPPVVGDTLVPPNDQESLQGERESLQGEPLATGADAAEPPQVARWYAVQVASSCEKKVKATLEQRAVTLGVDNRILEIEIPQTPGDRKSVV